MWVYGYHPAAAALANPQRKILRVVATPEVAERLQRDGSVAPYNLERIRTMDRRDIEGLVGADAVHQGVAVLTRPLDHDLHEILAGLEGRADACLVLLDQVTDPHNVGAILRSAAAFGASAVIAPDRHAPEETGVMAKSASGALDKVPYVKTVNLVRALEVIKEFQFWLVGLDAEAPAVLSDIDLSGRIALVLGAEGEGIRRLVAETCDHRARLPISNAMESLNVSNAAAVALYEKARQTTKR
ncbi:MAG: TrmH family RNA methyltransferase [Rhodospirillaceae bacterium]